MVIKHFLFFIFFISLLNINAKAEALPTIPIHSLPNTNSSNNNDVYYINNNITTYKYSNQSWLKTNGDLYVSFNKNNEFVTSLFVPNTESKAKKLDSTLKKGKTFAIFNSEELSDKIDEYRLDKLKLLNKPEDKNNLNEASYIIIETLFNSQKMEKISMYQQDNCYIIPKRKMLFDNKYLEGIEIIPITNFINIMLGKYSSVDIGDN